MLERAFVLAVLGGTSYAAYLDLKTSEVPDSASFLVASLGVLFYGGKTIAAAGAAPLELGLYAAAAGVILAVELLFLARAVGVRDGREDRLERAVQPTVAAFTFLAGYALLRGLLAGTASPLVASLLSGTALFLLGWGMYYVGMWGGADAFVLGAVGYALPQLPAAVTPAALAPWPFPVSLILTVFLVGAVYSVLYAAVTAARSDRFVDKLSQELEDRRERYALVILLYALVAGAGTVAVYTLFSPPLLLVLRNFAASLLLLSALLALAVFLRAVESRVMAREIPVEELAEGDVLGEDIDLGARRDDPVEDVTDRVAAALRAVLPFTLPGGNADHADRIAGLTAEQVEELRERRDRVTVRTGVRFVPAFPAAILVLLLAGDPLYLLLLQVL